MNELILKRTVFTEDSTIGHLYLPGGVFECFTLEDTVRDHKVPGQTAIPSGRYEVLITWSNRFKKPMPLLVNVPFYKGIRIHSGNTKDNTEGCILVGRTQEKDFIGESRLAFESLFPKLKDLCDTGKVYLNIEGGISPDRWVA